ncbi:MAG: type II toxin-antitoxin system RelE/ParE family toxin [Lysobacter sp.]|nr:type II toxin-antitoxin system RelE/ParE family toxin [Lysobacter sp.]
MVAQSFPVRFHRSPSGNEAVREWLRTLDARTRKAIGADIKQVEVGWPLGMPLVRKLDVGLWEIRSHVPSGIARVFFTMAGSTIVLLHAIIKKRGKTPRDDLAIAKTRRDEVKHGNA